MLKALSKPPYKPLREPSLNHLTYKMVFLLAMASTGRHSELQALVFDLKYIQIKPQGSGGTTYLSPEFMHKNQWPTQTDDPGTFQQSLVESQNLALLCSVRALRYMYYHRYICPNTQSYRNADSFCSSQLRTTPGKELSTTAISGWICNTIVESHSTIAKSKSFPKTVMAHEVNAVASALQLFSKVDLQTVMKTDRWSSGGTFKSFYLRDLFPQADCLSKAGRPLLAGGRVVVVTSAS